MQLSNSNKQLNESKYDQDKPLSWLPPKRERSSRMLWISLRRVRQWGISLCLALLVFIIMTTELPAAKTWTYWTLPLSGKIIAIDAGHGGVDGGAVSRNKGVIEKDVNLAIALQLRDYLQQAGAIVIMTRESDQDLADVDQKSLSKRKSQDLKRRVQLIQEKNPELLVSIHMNSIPSNRWSGAQTFYRDDLPANQQLAKLIQAEIKRNLENTERVAKPDDRNLYLLKMINLPSALVEVGFLSHPEESRLLADVDYQNKVATSIYKGILRYMSGETVGKD